MTLGTLTRPRELVRRFFDDSLFDPLWMEDTWPTYTDSFVPPIDIFHDEDKVTVRIEVPGMKKEDLDVHVEGDLLTIAGNKEHMESRNYHLMESRCGTFRRSLTLPHIVDTEKISADCKDGVLTLTMPMLAEAKPKQIPIHSE